MALGLNKVEAVGLAGFGKVPAADANCGARSALAVGALLALLQALDGVLTSLGVSRYGVAIEGNPILRSMMVQFGHIPTLGLVKLMAVIFVCTLTYYAQRQAWVRNAMGAITCVYFFAAVLPWTYILFIQS